LIDAADQLKRDNVAVEHARLCDDIYRYDRNYRGSNPNAYPAPEGWERLEISSTGSGFMAATYRSTIDGSIVVVFRGTDPGDYRDPVFGWTQTAQITEAIAYAEAAKAKYPTLTITGDSLGGGLAAVAANATGAPADIFNTMPLSPDTYSKHNLPRKNDPPINSYHVDGEILSYLPGYRPGTQYTLPPHGGPSMGPPGADGGFSLVDRPPGDPLAPRPDIPFDPRRGAALRILLQLASANRNGIPLNDYGAESGFNEAFLRHMPRTTVDSLEAQKAAAIATIRGFLP
jgi:hypothetical protein